MTDARYIPELSPSAREKRRPRTSPKQALRRLDARLAALSARFTVLSGPSCRQTAHPARLVIACAMGLALTLSACGDGASTGNGGGGGATAGTAEGETSGPAFEEPASIMQAAFDAASATTSAGTSIDISHVAEGYVAASAQNANRLKLQVVCGEMSYNYDLPGDGTPIVAPLNMGDGAYAFRVMQNTSGNNYVEIARAETSVTLASEFEPYLRPNLFCTYSDDSACVALARKLAADAANEGDVMRSVYTWLVENITYDYDKAAQVSGTTGYVPDPDATLEAKSGICFDYASLAAAMLRSLGIPTKIITGYVAPDGVYHAWNMIYINGSWTSVAIRIDPNTWTRVDITFAAAGAGDTVGDGSGYTDRYTY